MDQYNIVIFGDIFQKIQNDQANYIILLNNSKNKQIKSGNILTLENIDDESKMNVKVNDLLYFETIKDLFMMVNKDQCGYLAAANVDQIEDRYVKLFKDEKISEYGVIAAKIEKV